MEVYEIYHHGIKGMRWGVRRFQNKDGSLTPAGAKRQAKLEARRDAKERKKIDKEESVTRLKPVRGMPTEELNTRIKRLKLEKEYKDLVRDVEGISKGKKIIDSIFEKSIENIGTQGVTYLMGIGLNKIAKDAFGAKGDIVNPKKGQKDK